ncbi:MAG: sugar ABC transporter permease [Candidatus Vecturithrix sp.]|jgi:multiple sugar transport system permease protein|nr:sugar ABC transporter permease [Candidatus Vecturithrix sp.]
MFQKTSVNRLALYFILPALIATILVHFIPISWGVYIGFIDLDIKTLAQWTKAPFVGLQNFYTIFESASNVGERFIQSLWNIVLYGVITIPAGFAIALAVALLLHQQFVGRTLVRGLILLPYITPDAVMYNVWRFLFQARIGLVNKYLIAWGLIDEPLIWLVGERAMWSVVFSSIWKSWPFSCLILLAGLQSIPRDMYEAATIDGANWRHRFQYITFPMLWPVSRTLLLLSTIWTFHAFNQFYVMLGGDTTSRVAVPSLVILNEAFRNLHYGLGGAMSIIVLLVVFAFTSLLICGQKEETA